MGGIEQRDEALQRRSYELSVLNDVARALNASVDLPSLLGRALEKVTELLGLHTGWVLLFDEATGEPELAAAQNLPPGLLRQPERMEGWCFCLESFRAGNMDEAANVGVVTCSRLRRLAMVRGDTAGLRFHASVPLTVCIEGAAPNARREAGHAPCASPKRLGMLNVAASEWRELSDDELDLLRTIGDMLGVGIERARLHARRVEAVQTEERNRLAREIHDTIAQDFSAIAFRLEATEALLEQDADPDRIRQGITAALDLSRKGLVEARRSVLDLRPAPLDGHTLAEALAALVQEADAAPETTVTFESLPAARPLPAAVEIGLYRVAQEALQNALSHADAATIALRLQIAARDVHLTVEDDGRGFDVEAVSSGRSSGHFGLVGMRERVHLLGGTLQVESTEGVGTRVTVDVPLAAPPSS